MSEMHCDKVQRHYIGAAVGAKDLEAVVENWNSRFAAKTRPKKRPRNKRVAASTFSAICC